MRKKLLVLCFIGITGCGNLSPRLDPKLEEHIDNQNGKIGEIEHIQNGIKNEMLNLKQQAEIQNSKLDKVQNGVANLQNNTQYNGVQILSGSGGLVLGAIGMIILAFIAVSYRKQSITNAKTADMLAEKIVEKEDVGLETDVFKAAMYTDVEASVYNLIKKHQIRKGR